MTLKESPMKLFHTSDWHLGRMLYDRILLEAKRWL